MRKIRNSANCWEFWMNWGLISEENDRRTTSEREKSNTQTPKWKSIETRKTDEQKRKSENENGLSIARWLFTDIGSFSTFIDGFSVKLLNSADFLRKIGRNDEPLHAGSGGMGNAAWCLLCLSAALQRTAARTGRLQRREMGVGLVATNAISSHNPLQSRGFIIFLSSLLPLPAHSISLSCCLCLCLWPSKNNHHISKFSYRFSFLCRSTVFHRPKLDDSSAGQWQPDGGHFDCNQNTIGRGCSSGHWENRIVRQLSEYNQHGQDVRLLVQGEIFEHFYGKVRSLPSHFRKLGMPFELIDI